VPIRLRELVLGAVGHHVPPHAATKTCRLCGPALIRQNAEVNWKPIAITVVLVAVGTGALVGGALALFAQSAAGVAAAGEWFGGAATGAAFLWGVFLFRETQRVRDADQSATQLQRARLIRVTEANLLPDSHNVYVRATVLVNNHTDVDIFDLIGTVTLGDEWWSTVMERTLKKGEATTLSAGPFHGVTPEELAQSPSGPTSVTIRYTFPDGTVWRRKGDTDPIRVISSEDSIQ
jgi:hypothetical protein